LKSDADDLVGGPDGEPMPDLFSLPHGSGEGETSAAGEEPDECSGAADAFAEAGADEDLEKGMDEGSGEASERPSAEPEFAAERTESEDGPAAEGPGISGPVTEAASAEAVEEIPGETPGGTAAEVPEEHLDPVSEENLSEEADGKRSEEDAAGVPTEEAPAEAASAEAAASSGVAGGEVLSGESSADGVKPLRKQRRRRERDPEAEPKELFAFYEQSLF